MPHPVLPQPAGLGAQRGAPGRLAAAALPGGSPRGCRRSCGAREEARAEATRPARAAVGTGASGEASPARSLRGGSLHQQHQQRAAAFATSQPLA